MQISKTMRFMIGAAVAISAVVMPGCSKPSSGGADSNFITIKGSDTMNHLVAGWAEAYMAQHPDSNISVTGGGSGTGIAALLNQTTDLCMASREVKEEELKLASDKGIELNGACCRARWYRGRGPSREPDQRTDRGTDLEDLYRRIR